MFPAKKHFLFILLISFSISSQAQKTSLFDYLYSYDETDMPVLKIETNYKQIFKNKIKEKYQDGTFTFLGKENQTYKLDIKLKARGNMRKRVCKNPPLKLDFNKGQLDSIGLDTLDKIKLVIPCNGNNLSAENLKLEHFIYELYEQVQPYRVLTKLVKFEFWQAGKLKADMVGFLVEEEDHYAKRLDARIINKGAIRSSGFHRESFLKLCFFQYMIANTDWSISNRHNLEIVKLPQFDRVLPIAYDFDYAGIIDQPYAVPHESLPITDVSERYFSKTKISKYEAYATAQFYKNIKEQILATCKNATYLKEKTRRNVTSFINVFYRSLRDETSIERTFVRQ